MKIATILSAACFALTPLPGIAQSVPPYAKVMATQICTYMLQGMDHRKATEETIKDLFPVFKADLIQAGFDNAARRVVAERLILCGDLE
jgi:hypothetical protein